MNVFSPTKSSAAVALTVSACIFAGCSNLKPGLVGKPFAANHQTHVRPVNQRTSSAPPVAAPTTAPNITLQLVQARQLEQKGDLAGAAQVLRDMLDRHGENKEALHRLAVVMDKQGSPQQSQAFYQRALALSPHDEEVLCDFGYSYYLQGNLAQAEHYYQLALNSEPSFQRAHNNLGQLLARTKRPEEALRHFRYAGCTEEQANSNLQFALATNEKAQGTAPVAATAALPRSIPELPRLPVAASNTPVAVGPPPIQPPLDVEVPVVSSAHANLEMPAKLPLAGPPLPDRSVPTAVPVTPPSRQSAPTEVDPPKLVEKKPTNTNAVPRRNDAPYPRTASAIPSKSNLSRPSLTRPVLSRPANVEYEKVEFEKPVTRSRSTMPNLFKTVSNPYLSQRSPHTTNSGHLRTSGATKATAVNNAQDRLNGAAPASGWSSPQKTQFDLVDYQSGGKAARPNQTAAPITNQVAMPQRRRPVATGQPSAQPSPQSTGGKFLLQVNHSTQPGDDEYFGTLPQSPSVDENSKPVTFSIGDQN